MGRVNKYAAGLSRDRWETFGKRLETFRASTPLKQSEVATAVGISPRQWIRYTKGAPVPRERILKIAEVLGMPVGKALLYAGYEPEEPGVDVGDYLRLIRDHVFEGQMIEALFNLYVFYYNVNKEESRYKPMKAPMLANDFAAAAVAMNRMPGWLRREFIVYLIAIEQGSRKQEFPVSSKLQKEALAMIAKGLPKAMLLGGRLSPSEYRESGELKNSVPHPGRDTFEESTSDEAPLPLHSEPRRNESHTDRSAINEAAANLRIQFSEEEQGGIKQLRAFVSVDDQRDEFASLVSDAYLLKNILAKSEPEKLKEIERTIITRLHQHESNPVFNALSQQLEELKERHSQGLMIGFEYLKHMLNLAWKVSEAEREVDPWEPPGQVKAKLTKLFDEVRGNDPPALVERIINDIYAGIRIIHFTGWQQTFDGEHQVIKALRRLLRKYNLHLEQELFDRIYEYLKQYY